MAPNPDEINDIQLTHLKMHASEQLIAYILMDSRGPCPIPRRNARPQRHRGTWDGGGLSRRRRIQAASRKPAGDRGKSYGKLRRRFRCPRRRCCCCVHAQNYSTLRHLNK